MSDTVERSLGRIEGKLDALCESVQNHISSPHADPKDVEDLTRTVSGLMRLRWMVAGALALLSAGAGLAKVILG